MWVLSSVKAAYWICAADASPKGNVQVLEFCLGLNAAFLSLNQVPREHCITTKNLISTLCWGQRGCSIWGWFCTCSSLSLVQLLVPGAQLCCNHSQLLHHLHGGLWQQKNRK